MPHSGTLSVIWDQIVATSALEWFGTATGLAGVALSIRQHHGAWPMFIACYVAYTWIGTEADLLATAAMNAVFVVLSIEGWRAWKAGETDDDGVLVRPSPKGLWITSFAAWLGIAAAISTLLTLSGRADSTWLEASATGAAFVAQFLLTRKLIATWAFWLVSDLAFMVVYGYTGYWVTVGLFVVFTVLAVQGWFTWHRAAKAAP